MLFSSLTFVFKFLPIVLLAYFIVPDKFKNYVLLLASLVFYAWGGPSYLIVLVLSILFNYLIVNKINKRGEGKKMWLSIGVSANIILLGVFKYTNFFIENINSVFQGVHLENVAINPVSIVMPIGISFFTFQQMSMLWDVYRQERKEKLKLDQTALYIGLFPQLIAGPIVRYHDIIDQIKKRTHSITKIESGVKRFILGLFKKVVFANTCGMIADQIIVLNAFELSPVAAWLGIVAYGLQIYFDFAGYSDMAIGLGRIFGFNILENFNFPYISKSIQEFWRRWHISLSTWFRDYLYIPLGGNRKGNYRTYFNLAIVFLLTGFWHGSTWSFMFWGAFHGVFIIIERLGFAKVLERLPSLVSRFYTLLVVLIAWVFFRIESFSEALNYVKRMFSFGAEYKFKALSFLDNEKIVILCVAILSCTKIWELGVVYFNKKIGGNFSYLYFKIISYSILFLWTIMILNSSTYNPFIYWRF